MRACVLFVNAYCVLFILACVLMFGEGWQEVEGAYHLQSKSQHGTFGPAPCTAAADRPCHGVHKPFRWYCPVRAAVVSECEGEECEHMCMCACAFVWVNAFVFMRLCVLVITSVPTRMDHCECLRACACVCSCVMVLSLREDGASRRAVAV